MSQALGFLSGLAQIYTYFCFSRECSNHSIIDNEDQTDFFFFIRTLSPVLVLGPGQQAVVWVNFCHKSTKESTVSEASPTV